mgnify:CR=1 FL=1
MSPLIDSGYAWRRLLASVIISTMGGIGMWALAVAIPSVQQDLGVSRADISFSYSMNMLGFFLGGVLIGRLVDRHGIVVASIGVPVIGVLAWLIYRSRIPFRGALEFLVMVIQL